MNDPTPATRLEVGSIGKAHGLRGEVQVRLLTDRLERVAPGATMFTDDGHPMVVVSSRPHQKNHIVVFEGHVGRDAAEALRGTTLFADPIDDDDTLWVHELIGRTLVETDGTRRGTVVAVQENPASDLMVTDGGDLVPLTFVVSADGDSIEIDPPAGLFDLGRGDTED